MNKRVLTALVLAAALTACDQRAAESSAPKEPPFPSLSLDQLLALNKNERQEMERRCLGVSNKTCDTFKGDSFKKSDDLNRAFCNAGKTMDRITGATPSPNCDVYK